jgi:hypothetical protein
LDTSHSAEINRFIVASPFDLVFAR